MRAGRRIRRPKIDAGEVALLRFWAERSGLDRKNALKAWNELSDAERAERLTQAEKEMR